MITGDRLGPYEVLGKLGEGGMGQVYRAADTRLRRDVALKILPDAFAADRDRLARFEREAQVLASLNHPNIAHIHGLEESSPTGSGQVVRALVMELVEGEDLAQRLTHGPIRLDEALPIARQIADALEAAHEQGIIHRDLKPANIKVRADGTVKVLDFGLAKALEGDASAQPLRRGGEGSASMSPTITTPAMTQAGMILGTAAYMSPEQARGKPLDRRTDIWAFGCVLYEMLTGRRAFEGDDVSITLANVLKEDPKWEWLPEDLPPSLNRLLRRCLEKDSRRRLSAIGDARLELDDDEPAAGATPVTAPSIAGRLTWLPYLAAGLIGVALTALIAYLVRPSPAATVPVTSRLSILPPPNERLYPDSATIALSPDGTMVAFVVGAVSRADTQLWVRTLNSTTSRRLEDTSGARLPFWSPDSRRIGFFAEGKLKLIAAAGGRAEVLADAPSGRGGTWNSANMIVFAPDAAGPLYRIAVNNGKLEPATKLDSAKKEFSHRFPTFLPDGKHFLYASLPGKNGKFEVSAASLDDDSRTAVGSFEATPVFAESGWLMYSSQAVLTAVPFDARTLKVTGDPLALEDEPSTVLDPINSFTAAHSISMSATGSFAYYQAPSLNTTATWYDQAGRAIDTLRVPPGHYEGVAISPDGTRAILMKSASPSESSLWTVDLARGGTTPLSMGKGRNDAPVWSPDGARVVWASDRDGPQKLFVKTVNDAAPEQLLYASDVLFKQPVDWSRDGRWIVLSQLDQETAQNIWLLDASGAKPATLLVGGPKSDLGGSLSPDGRWIAYTSDDSGRQELYVQSFPTPGRRVQISEHGGAASWWTRDSRQLLYFEDDLRTLFRVDVRPGQTFETAAPVKIATLPPDVIAIDASPDRQRFLALTPEVTASGSLTVVQNWHAPAQK